MSGKKQTKWASPVRQFAKKKRQLTAPLHGVYSASDDNPSQDLPSDDTRSVYSEVTLDMASVGRPRTPWEEFTQEMHEVDCYSSTFNLTPRATPLRIRSSVCFDHVMRELGWPGSDTFHSEDDVTLGDIEETAAENDQDDGKMEEEGEEEVNEITDTDTDNRELDNSRQKQTARRAWAWVRRNIQEVSCGEKSKTSSLNWNVLHHTMSNLSDVEKSRQQLYRKYLENPNSWREGIQNFPAELPKAIPGPKANLTAISSREKTQESQSRISSSVGPQSARQRRQCRTVRTARHSQA